MLDFNTLKKNCTGCTACASICPKQCIKMELDAEGFLYPSASEDCIKCGLCKKVCPIESKFEVVNDKQKYYAALSKSYDIWHRSASGGAFSEICKAWGDEKTVIIGAAWNNMHVVHKCVIGVNNISPLCKSKYIASDLESSFHEAKSHLDDGGKVIFAGTPCQVAGIRSFLRKEYPNLLLIDLICHGVGSPAVFKSCMDVFAKEHNDQVLTYEFRHKRKLYEADYISRITTKKKEYLLSPDRYNQLFLNQLNLRPSCGKNCRFRMTARQGDITIADFKGLAVIFPELISSGKNMSTIVLNTDKGHYVLSKLKDKMDLYECDKKDIVKYNPLFAGHTWFSSERDAFFSDYAENPNNAILKWTKKDTPFNGSWKRKLFYMFPRTIRSLLIKIM